MLLAPVVINPDDLITEPELAELTRCCFARLGSGVIPDLHVYHNELRPKRRAKHDSVANARGAREGSPR